MVCLDTSILIAYIKGDGGIVSLVDSFAKEGMISTTAITEYELLRHPDKLKRDVAVEMLADMKIYDMDRNAAKESARIYRDLQEHGKKINENDILIAGIAISNREFLITRDSGFSDISEEDKIKIV